MRTQCRTLKARVKILIVTAGLVGIAPEVVAPLGAAAGGIAASIGGTMPLLALPKL